MRARELPCKRSTGDPSENQSAFTALQIGRTKGRPDQNGPWRTAAEPISVMTSRYDNREHANKAHTREILDQYMREVRMIRCDPSLSYPKDLSARCMTSYSGHRLRYTGRLHGPPFNVSIFPVCIAKSRYFQLMQHTKLL